MRRATRVGRAVGAFALGCAVAAHAREIVLGPPPSDADVPAAIALRAFGTRDGLMHSRVYALGQDGAGFVWAGTEAGVSRYDGRRWQTMDLPGVEHGIVPYVNALAGSADGAMWVATDELGLFRFADGRFTRVLIGDMHTRTALLAIAPVGADEVFVGGSHGVSRCGPGGCRAIEATRDLDVFCVRLGEIAGARVLWIGTVNDGVRELGDLDAAQPKLTEFALGREDGLPASTIRSIASFGGDLWVGTGEGLARVTPQRMTVYDRRNGMDTTTVAALVASRDVRGEPALYAGLRRGGLAELHADGAWQRFSTDRGLPDDNIISLLATDTERRTPRLWLGSRSSGVLRRDSGLWATIAATSRLPSGIIAGLGQSRFPDGKPHYWIGTADGSVRREAGRWEPFGPAPLDRASVHDAVNTADGALWLATDLGLFRLGAHGPEQVDRGPVGLAGDPIIALALRRGNDGAEEIWFGMRHGLGVVRDGVARLPPGAPPEWLGKHVVRTFALTDDSSGHQVLWVGSELGVARFDGERWDTLPAGCLAHQEAFDLRPNPHAKTPELWAATRAGVTRIRLGGPTVSCSNLGAPRLPGPMSYQIQFDAQGRAYVFGYLGATRVTPGASDSLDDAQLDRYDESDGLPALEFNRASMVDAFGRVWAGTIAGVAVYDPADEPQPQGQKALQLDAWVADPSLRRLAAGAAVGPDRADVRFDYRLLSFEREHRTRYQTELVGLDEPPSKWTDDDTITYSRLPPGRYEFRVLGRDALGTVSGPIAWQFSIVRPYWKRWWAILAYALAIAWLGSRVIRWRTRALARRATQLERIVAERTQALAQANDRLVRASITDPLTGLANRRYFTETVAVELEQLAHHFAEARRRPLRLLCLLDLDFFKAVNDQRGHAAGDAVLQALARCLREAAGERGVAMRWGGEEFLLILPLEGIEQAIVEAEGVLERVRATRTKLGTEELRVTASLGFALWPFDAESPDAVSLDTVLTLADQALYRAKARGRDRAVGAVHDPAGEPLPEKPTVRVRWIDKLEVA